MSKITHLVDNVPVYEDYVYFADWCSVNGYDAELAQDDDGVRDEFDSWSENNGLTGQYV
jgi:hypothetical protein